MTLALALVILALALLGAPLFSVIAAAAFLGLWATAPAPEDFLTLSQSLPMELYGKMAGSPLFVTLPLFTFAGYLLAESRAPQRLVAVSQSLLGWLPGGGALVAIATCAFFTAFTGASGVTIIALGGLLYPLLARDGYTEKFNLGLITTGGSLGLLFPPSLPIILYGLIAGVDIDHLFRAGILPGLFLMLVLAAYSAVAGRGQGRTLTPFSVREAAQALRAAAWELPIPAIILGGIYGGFFTPSEAAAVTTVYVLFVEVGVYRDVSVRALPDLARRSMILIGGVLIILAAALGFTNFLIIEEVPQKILGVMRAHIDSKVTFLILLNVFLLIVGCLMDIFSAILVVVPLIAPIARQYGVDPVHLGIIFLTNLEIGYITPPVGINLFLASLRFKRPVIDLYRVAVPFLILLLFALIVITYVPWLSTVGVPAPGK